MDNITDILRERGTRYGVFMGQARIAQSLHIVLRHGLEMAGKSPFDFAPDELEAMNMIVNKIARIHNGDNHYSDSWRDIAGYATLVADRLDNDTQEQRGCDEGCDCATEPAGTEPGVDNRPAGQPELRRLPVGLEVQDGIHNSTSELELYGRS